MSDRRPCVRCGRTIDGYARLCPFCNWMQDEPAPPPPPVTAAPPQPESVPPSEVEWRKPAMAVGGAVILVVLCFVIGAHVHGNNPPPVPSKDVPPSTAKAPPRPAPKASVMLVPDNEPVPAFGMPITSAPAAAQQPGVASEYNRTDATAASSAEYAQMAARAAAEKKAPPTIVNPLMISGSAYDEPGGAPPPPRRTAVLREQLPAAERVVRTPPVPEYQPVPDIRVSQNVTARIELLVGADGRVHDVNVLEPVPGNTGRLIGAVQTWRFRPAMQNGVPVSSSFSTAISFHANE